MEICKNYNSGFLVNSFSDDIQLINSFKEKEIKEESPTEIKDNQATKKWKSLKMLVVIQKKCYNSIITQNFIYHNY